MPPIEDGSSLTRKAWRQLECVRDEIGLPQLRIHSYEKCSEDLGRKGVTCEERLLNSPADPLPHQDEIKTLRHV